MRTQTPKGFRDYLPQDALKRQFVVGKIIEVFQKFGFDPLETPTLEYAETLLGKYGEEEKLIYKFETAGGDQVGMKYDQTVPLARVIAQYGPNGEQKITLPLKRYQIQSAFRGENTQKGRYREFLQCDADIIGISSPLADAEVLAMVIDIYQNLGLDVIVKVNDRKLFTDIEPKYLAAIDKLNKIGQEGVLKEMTGKGLSDSEASGLLEKVTNFKETDWLQEIKLELGRMGYPTEVVKFEPTLVRGLDYYTGMVVEVVLKSDPTSSSLGGGGRWDTMIGKFTGQDQPAVGFSVGLDRTMEAMTEAGVLEVPTTNTKVLVTVFSEELAFMSIETAATLRSNDISTEIWLDSETKLDKQLKYADAKGIPYVVIIGPDEAAKDQVTLKSLRDKVQETKSVEDSIAALQNDLQ
jgi:histidyl-tRNA synthetase